MKTEPQPPVTEGVIIMCGIMGFTGKKEALPILIKGMRDLSYRGSDSWGLATLNHELHLCKRAGRVDALEEWLLANGISMPGQSGISHTRWATTGGATDANAHPHRGDGGIAIVHNGVLEGYLTLKTALEAEGIIFHGETDTEVLAQHIAAVKRRTGAPIAEAVRRALETIKGSYAIIVVSQDAPGELVVAKKGPSPLLIGLGEDGNYAASDGLAIVPYTKRVAYLKTEQMAVITADTCEVQTLEGIPVPLVVEELKIDPEAMDLGGFERFMEKEIWQQPKKLRHAGRMQQSFKEGLTPFEATMSSAGRLILTACGTSYYASLIAELALEEFARIPVEVEYASEFHYRKNHLLFPNDVVMAVTQSGETADTLQALLEMKRKGVKALALCNVEGSTIAREADQTEFLHVGPEIGVASTVAFTGQVSAMIRKALRIARHRGTISPSLFREHMEELEGIPEKMEQVLKCDDLVQTIAQCHYQAPNALYLGRQYLYPIALEGALKLKEISYIHAEGYPAAEMKHGPIAMVEEGFPVVVLAPRNGSYDKVITNLEEVKARGAVVIAIVTQGDTEVRARADHVIEIPYVPEFLSPLLAVIPLQLLAYHIALLLGRDVDKPRNLAKSCTTE